MSDSLRRVLKHWLTIPIAMGAAVLLLLVLQAKAHDHWISAGKYKNKQTNQYCCGPSDCDIVNQYVQPVAGGYRVRYTYNQVIINWHRETAVRIVTPIEVDDFIPIEEATPSEDQNFYRCHGHNGVRRCFFAPIVAM